MLQSPGGSFFRPIVFVESKRLFGVSLGGLVIAHAYLPAAFGCFTRAALVMREHRDREYRSFLGSLIDLKQVLLPGRPRIASRLVVRGLVLQPGFRMDRATPHTLRSSEPKFFNFTGPPRAVNFTRNIRILDQKLFIFAI